MSAEEREDLKQEILKDARLGARIKLLWQVLTALGCTVSMIVAFTWNGKGWVDELKFTVRDNATFMKTRMDSLHNAHEYRIQNLEDDRDWMLGAMYPANKGIK